MPDEMLRRAIRRIARDAEIPGSPFVPGETPVPVSGKVIGAREREFMVEAALEGWLTAGRFNRAFEKALGEFLGVSHALTVNSGSSANLVALSVFTSSRWGERAIRPGDEVITVAAGFPTTIAPILQVGGVPVFLDVDRRTWNVDASRLEAALSPRTKAVILAHTLGIPFDIPAVAAFCKAHDLWFIEDCCDALGATWAGRLAGSFGHVGTLSFYPAHHITTGEGGAVFTNDAAIARAAASFRDWGRHCHCAPGQDNACGHRFDGRYGGLPQGYDHKYVYAEAGYNLKMTDLTAACGLAQMERLPGFIARRRENHAFLRERLASCPHLRFPELPEQASPSWFGMPLLLADSAPLSRTDLLRALNERRIGTRLLFAGNATRQPFMEGRTYRVAEPLTQSDALMERGFWLGVWPGLTEEMLMWTAQSVCELLGGA